MLLDEQAIVTTSNLYRDALELLNSPDLNITSLDLSENNLEFKETTILCNILYKLSGLQHLNLAGSKFSDRGAIVVIV